MSLLLGEVAPSGLNSNEPVKPIATIAVYNKQLEYLENQDAATCERELSAFKAHLKALRLANKATNWNWALPLVDAPEETREEFFAAVTRLLERQTSAVCRVRVFALLLELSSVELAPPAGNASQNLVVLSSNVDKKDGAASPAASSGGGAGAHGGGGVSFGHHALRVLRDIMPNVVGARDIFISCVEDPLIEILQNMSMAHVIAIFPLLLDILNDPYFVSMVHTDPDASNLFTLLAKTADVFKKVFLSLLTKVSPADGLSRPDARSLVFSLQQCGRVLTTIAQSPETATAIHGDGVFTALLFQNWQLFKRLDSDERWAHDSFMFFRLIGRICRGCPEAALYISGGVPSQQSTEVVAMLIGVFKSMPDKPNNESMFALAGPPVLNEDGTPVAKYSVDTFNASLLYCLSALLLNSERASTLMKDRKEGMKTPKDYFSKLFKWIHAYDNGEFLAACIESILLITRSPGLKTFKLMMEDRNYLCNEIHKIFKRLLTIQSSKVTRAHRDAVMFALDLMTYYSSVDKIASGLNNTLIQDFDRLSVLKQLLRYRGESILIDNDVKLSAARCLTQVNLLDLNKDVVLDLITLIKDVPSTMSSSMNACMTRLLEVAFRMSMFDGGGDVSASESAGIEHCGEVFRKEATEACAALYSTLEHGIVDDKSPVRVDSVVVKYRLAIVKVLMTAWVQTELRQSCESRGAIDTMVKALRAEQNALRWCKMRHERLTSVGRCVDCEEELLKNNFAQPTRSLPGDDLVVSNTTDEGSITNVLTSIRCPRCRDNISKGRSVIQETYTPLYLEQTWSGHDIKAVLETLKNLKEVDLVAFRVLHQGANILEGTTYDSCVYRLLQSPNFEHWNRELPGRSVKDCQEWERQNWSVRQARLRWAELHEYPISSAEMGQAGELADIQIKYFSSQYNFRDVDAQAQQQSQRAAWQTSIEASYQDERLLHLVLKNSEGAIMAVCTGGALRSSVYVPSAEEADDGPFAELYGMYLSPNVPEDEAATIQNRLLSTWSSRMFALGFRCCFAKAHRSERLLFSVARGVDVDLAANAAAASRRAASTRDGGASSNQHPGAATASMGSQTKEFLYVWSLSENVWRRTPAHEDFMSLNGLQLFLDFVLRDTIKIQQLFTSTIRDVMEDFGDELQDSLRRHAEATKSGAIRVPQGGEGDKKSVLNSQDSQLQTDWEKMLPPPLPVDAYDLGDAPIAGSGVLAVLNAPEDHLYKHIFPLMLQNKFRADPSERNRSEESPWMSSLLGTVQENLLTVSANYASASSVYEESTWVRKEVKKKGAKVKVAAPGGAPEPASSRPSVDVSAASSSSSAVATAGSSNPAAASAAAAAAAVSLAASATQENDLLKHQAEGACAAIFRACYILVVSGSLSVRRKASSVLRAPANFYKLRCLMASFSYGIRSSILQPPSPPYLCAMSTNFMQLMEELLPETTVGTEEGLACLEIYEVFFLVIADLFTSLMSLLRSRNEHAKDPMHALRRLSAAEESVMAAAANLCYKLIQRIQHLTLFPAGGDYLFLVRANTEARAKAMQELLIRNKPLFQAALFTFLVYDLEQLPERTEAEEDELEAEAQAAEEEEQKFNSAGPKQPVAEVQLPIRDSMRINILWTLASFFHVSPAIQRDFLHQYHVSLITMDLGLRPSLLHSLLATQQQLMARDKIYQHLMKTKELAQDEFIVDHAMVDYYSSQKESFSFTKDASSSVSGPSVRVLILTNLAYYLSNPISAGEEGWGWLERLTPHRRDYADIRSLSLLLGGQGFQLVRFAETSSDRLASPAPLLSNVYEIFSVHQLGLAQRILYAFTRAQRDDFGCAMTIQPDGMSKPSLTRLYQSMALQNASSMHEKLFTHILIRHKGKMVPRVLAWLQQGRSGGGDGVLLIAECDSVQYAAPPLNEGHIPEKEIFPAGVKFNLNGLESVDFPEDTSGMVLGFNEVNLHIMFHDDAARQLWRTALKANFIKNMESSGNWKAAMLPSNQQARLVYATKLL